MIGQIVNTSILTDKIGKSQVKKVCIGERTIIWGDFRKEIRWLISWIRCLWRSSLSRRGVRGRRHRWTLYMSKVSPTSTKTCSTLYETNLASLTLKKRLSAPTKTSRTTLDSLFPRFRPVSMPKKLTKMWLNKGFVCTRPVRIIAKNQLWNRNGSLSKIISQVRIPR